MLAKKRNHCCVFCNKLKIKCNMEKPTCNQCLKRNRICIYLKKGEKFSSDLQQYITNIRIQYKIPISAETTVEQIFLSSKANQLWLLRLIRGTIFYSDPNFLWIRSGRITESLEFLQTSAKHSLVILFHLTFYECY